MYEFDWAATGTVAKIASTRQIGIQDHFIFVSRRASLHDATLLILGCTSIAESGNPDGARPCTTVGEVLF
jgi:hypothetical protein